MKPIPRLRFAHLPTPVEPLPRLTAALGGPQIFAKRDDQTGLAMGGNKTRKLEFLLAEAQSHGARTLITAGAAQSNHCRQTAAAAARYGFTCILVLVTRDPGADQVLSGNLLLDDLLGAEVIWTEPASRDSALRQVFDTAWEAGRRPYLIPYGGSSPTGAAGYAFAVDELVQQAAQFGGSELPGWIVFPTSSGGTQAGLALGRRLFNYPGKILGISIDEEAGPLKERVSKLATETAVLLGEEIKVEADEVLVNDEYLGGGYGVLGEPEREAVRLFARSEGLILDPVYTGRAAAGLIDLVRKGFFPRGESVLFWHTGGAPALFADKYQSIV